MSRLNLLAVLGIVGAAAPAWADGGWTPVPAPTSTIPAGDACAFAVRIEALKNQVVSKTIATHGDGSPSQVLYKGDLVERLTNLENRHSIVRDSGAVGVNDLGEDGSSRWTFVGPIVWGFAPGDPSTPGLYAFDGLTVVTLSATGDEQLVVADGPRQSVCQALR